MTDDASTPARRGGDGVKSTKSMDSDGATGGVKADKADKVDARGKRRGRKKKRHTVGTVVTATLVVVSIVTALAVVFTFRHLQDNVDYQDLSGQLTDRPDKVDVDTGPQEPLNILVMGSDTREGEGNRIDGEAGGGGSDTTILFHLSANREFAYGVSIPRDTLVDRPDCLDKDGDTIPGEEGAQWNTAFTVGGPACTMQQFEQLTGIRLDNYVVLDFNGFKNMVDAVDGVEVCIPDDIEDPAHGINIPAGTREIRGKEALNYVRARYTLGDGSDIGRVKRQQAFIAAMASKVVSGSTLSRPDRVVGFLNAATNSLQTDFKSITEMGRVGLSFNGIGLDKIQFITAPWQYAPSDPNRVELLPQADRLWKRIINDEPLTRNLQDGVITAGDDPDGSNEPSDDSASETPSGSPTDPGAGPDRPRNSQDEARRQAEREAAGLCV